MQVLFSLLLFSKHSKERNTNADKMKIRAMINIYKDWSDLLWFLEFLRQILFYLTEAKDYVHTQWLSSQVL